MSFVKGNRVIVKSREELIETYQRTIMPYGVKLTDEMLGYAGKIVTIKERKTIEFSDYFQIEEDCGNNVWWDGAFCPDPVRRMGQQIIPNEQLNTNDPVAHPAHYTYGKIEVIDFIQDKDLNFALGNAVKYIVRAGHKAEQGMSDEEKAIQDLEKARQYIDFEIKHRKEARDRGSK